MNNMNSLDVRQQIINLQNELPNDLKAISEKLNNLRVLIGQWNVNQNREDLLGNPHGSVFGSPVQQFLVPDGVPVVIPRQKPVDGYPIVCDVCHKNSSVKFKPNPNRPVLCLSCYKEQNPGY